MTSPRPAPVGEPHRCPEPPKGTRLVLMSEELALSLGADRVEWGEPDEHGWYTPTLFKGFTDNRPRRTPH